MGQNKKTGQTLRQEHTPQHGQSFGHVHQAQEREYSRQDRLGMEQHRDGEISPNEHHGHIHPTDGSVIKDRTTVFIDHTPYHASKDQLTVAELRKLPTPPIGADKKLYRVVADHGEDIMLQDSELIEVNIQKADRGRHFYTAVTTPTKEQLAERAYQIYQQDGCRPGHDDENWKKAEAQFKSELKP